jgi:large subunit ribosomal protein L15
MKDKQHDPHGREPFRHPATESVEVLSGGARNWFTHHTQLASIAQQYGIPDVVRWHPKNVSAAISFLPVNKHADPTAA